MTAILQIQLGDALTADELRELTEAALEQRQPLERVLLEAARALAARRRAERAGRGLGKSPSLEAA